MPNLPAPRILFAPAAGEGVGGGHVMRCYALAQALAARGADCAFAVNTAGVSILNRFSDRPWPIEPLDAAADVVVMDDYGMAAGLEGRHKERVALLAVIDDLADRPHLADLLVDPGDGRTPADYAGLVPEGAVVLTGPDYALIRATFAEARDRRRTAVSPEIERVFVAYGLSDVGGVTARTVALLGALSPETAIDVAVPSNTESLGRLAAMLPLNPRLTLHIDAVDVADLLLTADIAIGAGGASTWERCCLGVPAIAVPLADNQRELIARLSEGGVLLGLPGFPLQRGKAEGTFEDGLGAAFLRLRDPAVRERMVAASFAACDGLGAQRVAEAILAQLSRMRSASGS